MPTLNLTRETFFLHVFPTGARVATLRDVSRAEARELRAAEERERGESVLLYDHAHRLVPETASYR